ncbi:MAG: uracil-DNA glycosylase [Gammaproteobacteria bacterium]|nr:uracil-DNA glycosylase [Gammaproteobacteria bacterium]
MGIDVWVPRVDGTRDSGLGTRETIAASVTETLTAATAQSKAPSDRPETRPFRDEAPRSFSRPAEILHSEGQNPGCDVRLNHPPSPESRVSSPADTDVAQLDWNALEQRVAGCTLCGLQETRTQTVFGVGSHTADWLFVGEAPGRDEDAQGEPFVGRAGQLLNNMLRALGLSREQVFIANVLKCRPPKNRDPKPIEAACCEPYLKRQIALLRPKIIIALGRIAAQNLLRTDTPIGKMRGHQYVYADTGIPLLVTYHPAYLLRSPLEKRKAWEDLLRAKKLVQSA